MVVQWKILGGDIVTMNMCLPEKNSREGRELGKTFKIYANYGYSEIKGRKKFGHIFLGR